MSNDEKVFNAAAETVWLFVRTYLEHFFGEKCDEYEYGCECCERWKLAEQLLAYERIARRGDLEREIQELEECLKWRKELLESLPKRTH